MKKLLLAAIMAVIFIPANKVFAQDTERIGSFHSDINIGKNGLVEVRENIKYYFPEPRHSIIRYIPVKYDIKRNGGLTGKYNVYLTLKSVNLLPENGGIQSVPYVKSKSGNNVEIKIGDAEKTVTGSQTYQITYTVQQVINFSPARPDDAGRSGSPKDNENQDEFYWNVTGNGWGVPIQESSAVINFPEEINSENWKFGCFTGALGAQSQECGFEAISKTSVEYKSKWELTAGEGLTVLAGMPKNVVVPPTPQESFWLALRNNFFAYTALLIPIITFIMMFSLWFLRGRDPKGKGTIIPFYRPPDDLTPVELGTLVDEKADLKDISSAIIDLAVRGYLKIREIEKKALFGLFKNNPDYELVKTRPADMTIPTREKEIMDTIFSGGVSTVKMSELQDHFPQKVSAIKNNIFADLVSKGYFPKNPSKTRKFYLFLGIVVGLVGLIIYANELGALGAGSMLLTGAIIAIFGYFMPQKTIKGVNTYEQILGLKEYMSVAEADRIKFHNAPEKKPEVFEKLLPYAMVLGVEKE